MSETVAPPTVACARCGQLMWAGWAFEASDHKNYCAECYWELFARCPRCGRIVDRDSLVEAPNGELICEDCWYENYVECASCGEVVHRDSALMTPDGEEYCEGCWYEYCTTCIACGATIWSEDAVYTRGGEGPYCEGCAPPPGPIEDYGYKPCPVFAKEPYENTLYLGVELEVECNDDPEGVAEALLDYLPNELTNNERVYFKYDGSLQNGFEIVFHPTTWKRWHRYSPALVVEAVQEAGGYSASTCGIHIHLSRQFLGRRGVDRLAVFFTRCWDEICKIAGRWNSQWAKLLPYAPHDIAKNWHYAPSNRYLAVNTATSEGTVELRVFRSTTDPQEFIAFLQFADAVAHFARMFSALAMQWDVFCGWLEQTNRYGHLVQYMKILGIWVPYWERKKEVVV